MALKRTWVVIISRLISLSQLITFQGFLGLGRWKYSVFPKRKTQKRPLFWSIPVPHWNISTTIGWITIKFRSHIHRTQRINCKNNDLLTSYIAPLSSQIKIYNTLFLTKHDCKTNDIPIKHYTFLKGQFTQKMKPILGAYIHFEQNNLDHKGCLISDYLNLILDPVHVQFVSLLFKVFVGSYMWMQLCV